MVGATPLTAGGATGRTHGRVDGWSMRVLTVAQRLWLITGLITYEFTFTCVDFFGQGGLFSLAKREYLCYSYGQQSSFELGKGQHYAFIQSAQAEQISRPLLVIFDLPGPFVCWCFTGK